jgi:cytoskeletal protein CcmA (bactofilin family)
MRVEGDIAFTGLLRVQGDVLGDVVCRDDAAGAVVVDGTGSISGTIDVPRIVVRGRVLGPLHASQSIDIQQGASVVGDAFYKEMDIHAGAVVDGLLTPMLPMAGDRTGLAPHADAPKLPPIREYATHDSRLAARLGGGRRLVVAALLVVAAGVTAWMSRDQATVAPDVVSVAAEADTSARGTLAAPNAQAASDRQQDARGAAERTSPFAGEANAPVGSVVRVPATERPAGEAEEVVTVHGVNPAKPAGFFLLISKEPAVLFKKKNQEDGEDKRIDVSRGKTVSIAIGKNELFRVAEGQAIEIFYQGRKVALKTIESGAWMRFISQSSRGESEDR